MNQIIATINGINEWMGRFVGILTLILAVVMLAIVVLRYGFSMSSVWLSESVMYLHGLIFMLGAAYTLKHNGHVRVDIFQRRYSRRQRAWVEIGGTVLLLWPVALFILFMSQTYVESAWRIMEGSREPGGIPFLYLLKTLLIVMPVLLIIQGLAELLRAMEVLRSPSPAVPDPNLEESTHCEDGL